MIWINIWRWERETCMVYVMQGKINGQTGESYNKTRGWDASFASLSGWLDGVN